MDSLNQVDPSWSEEMEVVFENEDDRRLFVPVTGNATSGKLRGRSRRDHAGDSYENYASQKAVMEVPLVLSSDGLSMKRSTSMSTRSKFPIVGKWHGGLETSSLMRGKTGYSTGSGVLSYHFGSKCRLGVGVSSSQGSHQARMAGTWCTRKSQFTATVHRQLPTARTPLKRELWKMNLCATREIDSRLSANASCELEPPERDGPRYRMHIGLQSKTVHQWNLGYGWNNQMALPALSLSLRPRLSSPHRSLDLFASWRGGSWSHWNVGGSLVQAGSKNSPIKLSVGVSHGNPLTNGLVWLFTWIQGDFTLRIPIELPSLQTGSKTLWSMYPVQALYFSILSRIIQDIIVDVVGSVKDTHKDEAVEKEQKMSREKSKQEATMQQEFMGRQAKLRIENERNIQNGLVIEKALYYVEGREESVWDVTIPLQFWVTDSQLVLPSYSKRNMLGFYDIADTEDEKEKAVTSDGSKKKSVNSIISFVKGLWVYEPNTEGSAASSLNAPKLWVQYQHGSKFYEIEVFDDDELVLPDAEAMQVSAERVGLTRA